MINRSIDGVLGVFLKVSFFFHEDPSKIMAFHCFLDGIQSANPPIPLTESGSSTTASLRGRERGTVRSFACGWKKPPNFHGNSGPKFQVKFMIGMKIPVLVDVFSVRNG